jgi:hypothetical protein
MRIANHSSPFSTGSLVLQYPRQHEVLSFLLLLSQDYPDISSWFCGKVWPGLHGGTRKLLVLERQGAIAAVGIAKNEGGEKKICTVRVAQRLQGYGYGLRLFDELLGWLETDTPVLSVSSEKLPIFQRIFDHYGFRQSSIKRGFYRPNSTEIFFNESHFVQ